MTESIRNLGEYVVPISLTLDLLPEVTVFVVRESEVGKRPAPVVEEELAEQTEELTEEVEAAEETVDETEELSE